MALLLMGHVSQSAGPEYYRSITRSNLVLSHFLLVYPNFSAKIMVMVPGKILHHLHHMILNSTLDCTEGREHTNWIGLTFYGDKNKLTKNGSLRM